MAPRDLEKREAAKKGENPDLEVRDVVAPVQRRKHDDEPLGPDIHSRGDQMRPKDMEHHLDRLWPGRDDA